MYLGIDIDKRQLDRYAAEEHRKACIYVQADVVQLPLGWLGFPFDVAVCIDGIEHLGKADALNLLSKMERWAKKVIVVTPDAFFTNSHNDVTGEEWKAQYQLHKSLITEDEFVDMGYDVRVKQPEVLGFNCMMYVKES